MTRRVALFTEYRFTHFSPQIETSGFTIDDVDVADLEIETELDTHYLLGGVSLRF